MWTQLHCTIVQYLAPAWPQFCRRNFKEELYCDLLWPFCLPERAVVIKEHFQIVTLKTWLVSLKTIPTIYFIRTIYPLAINNNTCNKVLPVKEIKQISWSWFMVISELSLILFGESSRNFSESITITFCFVWVCR